MSKQGELSQEKQTISVIYDLPDKPEKVWKALTDPKLLAQWLMPNDICAEVGRFFTLKAPPVPGWDGTVHCEVREVVLHRLLVYTWRGGLPKSDGDGYEVDTVVTWKLTPTTTGGTQLSLEHAGFDPESFAYKTLSQGWHGKVADQITKILAREM